MKQPSLLKIFKLLEQMEKEGILSRWAIGGSIGVMFYTEPYLTKDIDIFVYVEPTRSGLINMNYIYDWLKDKGYSKFEGHSIIAEDWLVDFISAKEGLIDEAVVKCNKFKIDNIVLNVISPEYLIAMALESGRRQDYAKIEKILQQSKINKNKFTRILKKFGLYKKWEAYG
ncbi:MAG: nucleotidyltransferase [Nitrospinae bacterium]|nr:nucleotidyltransferase [Nitrospinota bacterium]MBI3813193.1 nucleotidyltransferase [Nitrospinota bacterium]